MPKNMLDNPEAQRFFLMCIERIFSLDKNVDIEIKKFILNLKRIQKEQLEPILLDQNFSFDGSNTERVIAKRTVQFEEKLASLVLQKLPTMILIASKTEADREFLLRGMASFFDSISRLILRFQMHPLARRSFVARNLQIKILAYNRLLAKNKTWLFDATLSDEERAEPFTHAMQKIKDSYDEAIESDNQVDELIAEYRHYANKVESGSLWSKLGFGKPKYTLEELTEAKQSVSEEFLIEIFKIAKDYRQAMVFMEYETSFNADENFRHYAIANEKHYLTRLPYVISLPEDRTYFTLAGLADDINWQIFSQVDNV